MIVFVQPVQEIYWGLKNKNIPTPILFLLTTTLSTTVFIYSRFHYIPVGKNYLTIFLYFCFVSIPFWFWGLVQVGKSRRLTRRLTKVFQSIGLSNKMGRLPGFVFDRPIDEITRKLRLTSAAIPLEQFKRSKPALETALQIYIDDIRENRKVGSFDITYAHEQMPELVRLTNIGDYRDLSFVVGSARTRPVTTNLHECPHLLVAGQTGGGKSNFLRQMISTLYLNNTDMDLILIDLKGGLEFQLFENVKRVRVVGGMAEAVDQTKEIQNILDSRMKFLRANSFSSIDALEQELQKKDSPHDRKVLEENKKRFLIVVDEAAEMFLAGGHAKADQVQTAKRTLSQVGRQGRALGIHLVIATQRPDVNALDSQIKANLVGVVSFPMPNLPSSMTVLGNGRAADLPNIPGRAIWRSGGDLIEVQTPLLTVDASAKLLDPFRKPKPAQSESNLTQFPPTAMKDIVNSSADSPNSGHHNAN